MAIGTTAAILGAAVIGAGASIIGSNAQGNAIDNASDAQTASTQAQLQLGRETISANRDIYNRNSALLQPFVGRGNVAGDAINSMLGIPSGQAATNSLPSAATAPLGGTAGGAPQLSPEQQWAQGAINAMLPNVTRSSVRSQLASMSGDPVGALNYLMALSPPSSDQYPLYQAYANSNPRPAPGAAPVGSPQNYATGGTAGPMPERPQDAIGGTGPLAPPATGTPTAQTQNDAFTNFANSAGMQFQLKQGTDAINNLYAGRGALQSGAAMKGISDYAQDTAISRYFMPYMSLLGGQQATGAQAGSAVAGVGSNFGNTIAGANGSMMNSLQSGSANMGNLALQGGQNQANMWGNIGSSVGTALGGMSGGGGSIPRPNFNAQQPTNFYQGSLI